MSHLLMVYGTLKRGFYNHRVMGDAKFLGECITRGFVMRDLGSFPCVTKGDSTVLGELYELTDEQFQYCDRLEGYPSFYNREQVTAHMTEMVGDEFPSHNGVWIYTMHNSKAPIIASGTWERRV